MAEAVAICRLLGQPHLRRQKLGNMTLTQPVRRKYRTEVASHRSRTGCCHPSEHTCSNWTGQMDWAARGKMTSAVERSQPCLSSYPTSRLEIQGTTVQPDLSGMYWPLHPTAAEYVIARAPRTPTKTNHKTSPRECARLNYTVHVLIRNGSKLEINTRKRARESKYLETK